MASPAMRKELTGPGFGEVHQKFQVFIVVEFSALILRQSRGLFLLQQFNRTRASLLRRLEIHNLSRISPGYKISDFVVRFHLPSIAGRCLCRKMRLSYRDSAAGKHRLHCSSNSPRPTRSWVEGIRKVSFSTAAQSLASDSINKARAARIRTPKETLVRAAR